MRVVVLRLIAALSVPLLVIGGLITFPLASSAAEGPSVTAQIAASSPTSLEVTVNGTGYDATAPGIYVGISESGGASTADASVYRGTKYIQHTAIGDGGTFNTTLTLDASAIATLDPAKTYSVYTFKAHGSPDRTQDVEKTLNLDFDSLGLTQPEPTNPAITTQITASTPDEFSVKVTGSGFATTAPGVYVALGDTFSWADASVYAKTAWIRDTAMGPGGTFETTLSLDATAIATLDPAKTYSIYTFKAHGSTDRSQDVTEPLAIDWDSLDGTVPDPGTNPGAEPDPSEKPTSIGHLTWGVNASFRSYVTGPIANGSIVLDNGAKESGNAFRFPQSSSDAKKTNGIGTTSYRGIVLFSGHEGALTLNLSSPRVNVESASSASLSMTINGKRSTIATLDLSRAAKSTSGGAVTFRNAPARLTAGGATAFSGRYAIGELMDPVTFAIGANSKALGGGKTTVAAAAVKTSWTPPATPPSSEGLDVAFDDPDNVLAGASFTASATGFEPNEEDIKVVVYSEPVVLEKALTADVTGKASWSGLLPSSLEAGEHTLTFQGSVNRGVTFTIKDDDTDSQSCSITDASFDWGVKESFRSYISGSIANGEWKTSGKASYQTPVFTFAGGHGGFDAASTQGEVEFDGAINFSGHDGALTVDLADPTVKIVDADTAYLLFDTTSGSMEAAMGGDAKTATSEDVPLVKLDLFEAELTTDADGTTAATAVPTTLTTQGEEVFSNYDAGTAFDPIDLTITNASDCATAEIASTPAATAAVVTEDSDGTSPLWWVLAALGAIVVVGGGGALLIGRKGAAS